LTVSASAGKKCTATVRLVPIRLTTLPHMFNCAVDLSLAIQNPSEITMKLFQLSPAVVRAVCVQARTITITAALLFMFAMAQFAKAQQVTPAPENNNEVIKQLSKRVEELEARLKELEAKRENAGAPAATPSPDQEAGKDGAADQARPDGTTGRSSTGMPRLRIHGFGELELGRSFEKAGSNTSTLGELALIITSRLSNKLSMLGDVEFEAGDHNKLSVGIERLLLQYSPSDYFNLSAGRYFTRIGYYNSVHRGTWLQTTAEPPFIFSHEDEGGILPNHNLGVSANGNIPSGQLGLRYIVEAGAAHTSRSTLDKPERTIDENNSVAFNLGLIARPDKIPGLQAGFSIYRDRIAAEGLPKIGQTIMAVHLVYQGRKFEMLNEALMLRHASLGAGRVWNTTGFYTQLARQFGKYRPYFRYEYTNAPRSEPLFSDVGRRNGPMFGIRYDLAEFVAFKAQYQRTLRRLLTPLNDLMFQLSFAF